MKKLFAFLFIVFALPVFGALNVGSRHRAQAFNSVAIAGHSTAGGGWCQCGCLDCICFPDEVPMACGGNRSTHGDEGGVMLLLFALALAARFALRR